MVKGKRKMAYAGCSAKFRGVVAGGRFWCTCACLGVCAYLGLVTLCIECQLEGADTGRRGIAFFHLHRHLHKLKNKHGLE